MCDQHGLLHGATGHDEWVLDTPAMRAFIGEVRDAIDAHPGDPAAACEAISPAFEALLADDHWLPADYQADAPESGMGGGIGQWLLFRAGDGSLSLFSLVVPVGAQTPIHDHLAWGLVGLYRGSQHDEVYEKARDGLRLVEAKPIEPGDLYSLLPPDGDIHRVKTTSDTTSVSIHLLTNDTGCTWRHRFELDTGLVLPFRSGYVNAPCADDEAETPAGAACS